MAFDLWLIYLVATLGLALTPGPNSLLALTHGGLYGARHALATILGGVVGFSLLIALAMFGLSALLRAAPAALLALKWLGGAYLVKDESELAIKAFERAVELRPDFWWVARMALPQARRPLD